MNQDRPHADREDRHRNQVTADDVGTAASASTDGAAPAGGDPEQGLTAAGGAAGGAAAGTAAGMVTLGPIGAIIGAIAGAVGGGWAGLASGQETARGYADRHDTEYRAHYEADEQRVADRRYEDVRVAYQLGHFAADNPDYAGRSFEEIEPDLRRGWTSDVEARHGPWESASRYARAAYQSQSSRSARHGIADLQMGGTASHQRPSFADPIAPGDPDGVLGPPAEPER